MGCRCTGCCDGSPQLTKPGRALLANDIGPPLSSVVVDTPPELAVGIWRCSGERHSSRPLTLRCRNRVAQVGQWTSDGVVVLGLEDIRERARLLERRLHVRKTQGHWTPHVPDLDSLDAFAQRQVLAHEIGHELDQQERRSSPMCIPRLWRTIGRGGWKVSVRAAMKTWAPSSLPSWVAMFKAVPILVRRTERKRIGKDSSPVASLQRSLSLTRYPEKPHRHARLPPSSSGPSVGEVLGIFALGQPPWLASPPLSVVVTIYDEKAGRYRDKRGRFRRADVRRSSSSLRP